MRGGTSVTSVAADAGRGLSPHARGNRTAGGLPRSVAGPIPACAGEPHARARRRLMCWAYPRMRGGTLLLLLGKLAAGGLSPHARGNRPLLAPMALRPGPIPACAGEPQRSRGHNRGIGAYPRMRGGTSGPMTGLPGLNGLSPHARGNLHRAIFQEFVSGPIPACAGEPLAPAPHVEGQRAYPRMRGGTSATRCSHSVSSGLSPHARGNLHIFKAAQGDVGPIPACAGEPRCAVRRQTAAWAYPRMRGGTKLAKLTLRLLEGLSPHARGNQRCLGAAEGAEGPIPACAGEPRHIHWHDRQRRAYPRMRGGTAARQARRNQDGGLSPHARGNR